MLNDHCPIESPLITHQFDSLYYIKDRLFSQIDDIILYDRFSVGMW